MSSTAAPAAVFDAFPIGFRIRGDAFDQIEGRLRVFLSDALRKVNARLEEAGLTEIVVNKSVLAVFTLPDAANEIDSPARLALNNAGAEAVLAPTERLGRSRPAPLDAWPAWRNQFYAALAGGSASTE